jgi:hypothetical protein
MSRVVSLIKLSRVAVLGAAFAVSSAAMANTVCVFDLLGAGGDASNLMKDLKVSAAKWGTTLDLKTYTDERVAAEDFKAGQCDAVFMTGLRAREFNFFTGSIDSLGGVPSYKDMQGVLATLAGPGAAKFMSIGDFEVSGIIPFGAAYLFVNDRAINNVSKLSGKKIAYLDYDKAQNKMIQKVGAQGVASDITNFAGKFNNGSVDVIGAPAAAFKPLELYKGLGTKGAIARFPVIQLTYQLVIRKSKFPDGWGQKSRTFFEGQYDRSMSLIKTAEAQIDAKYWMDIPADDQAKYVVLLRDSRIALTNDGLYDKKMMHVLKTIRCKNNATDAECAQNLE